MDNAAHGDNTMTAKHSGLAAPKTSQKAAKNDNRQQAFIEHYLICWNGSEAARRAGYSPHTAQEQASRLLSNVIIQNAIIARIAELKAGADEVLLRLASHSRGSMEDFISPGGNVDIERARDAGKLHLIKKFKVTTITHEDSETHIQEVELYDAQAATVQLAKILGQFIDRLKVTVDVTGKSDSELVREFTGLMDTARARAGVGDSGGTAAAGAGGDGGE